MLGTILQPTYLPWMGYFEMIDSTEVYVVFDHVQLAKKSWQHRNNIKTSNGMLQLTIPIKRRGRDVRISQAEISYDNGNPLKSHWKTIAFSYKKAPYFETYRPIFEEIFSKKYDRLCDLNTLIIMKICNILGIETKIIFSSKLSFNDDENVQKSEKVINLCEAVGITHLYDASGAKEILDTSLFHKKNILITFQNFKHPIYKQLWGGFIPYLSVIDLIFNEGDRSLEIIKSGKIK